MASDEKYVAGIFGGAIAIIALWNLTRSNKKIIAGSEGMGYKVYSDGSVGASINVKGEKIWVLLKEGNHYEGKGYVVSFPIFNDIDMYKKLVKFSGGNKDSLPRLVEIYDEDYQEGDEYLVISVEEYIKGLEN